MLWPTYLLVIFTLWRFYYLFAAFQQQTWFDKLIQLIFSRRCVKIFTIICVVVILALRGGDRLTHPQLWAEDGAVFFQDAYNLSFLQSISTPYAGYFHVLPRILAEVAMFFRLELIPLVFVVSSFLVIAGCCSFFLLDSFDYLPLNLLQRSVFCVLLAAMPANDEILLRFVNMQWYIGVFCMLLVLMPPPRHWTMRIVYLLTWLLAAASAPLSALFLPCLAIKAWIDWRGRYILLLSCLAIASIFVLIVKLRVLSSGAEEKQSLAALIIALINIFSYRTLGAAWLGSVGLQTYLPLDRASLAYLFNIPFLLLTVFLLLKIWHLKNWYLLLTLGFLYYCMFGFILFTLIGRSSFVQSAQSIGSGYGGERYYILSIAALYLLMLCVIYLFFQQMQWLMLATSLFCLSLFFGIRLDFAVSQLNDWQWISAVQRIE